MYISCNKLKKHIKNSAKIDFKKIWDIFTIRTAEVEKVEIKGEDLKNVVVAEIIQHEIHPKKDKYNILKLTDGTKEYDVLCGAPNCRKGLKVAFVKPGGMVSGFEIGEKTIAGVLSQGMCCAVDELGIGTDHEGILELPADAPLGMDITEYIPEIKDIIVEIDNKSLTNRPDLWGHYGIAREIAAITGNELLPLEVEEVQNDKEDLNITVKQPELCRRYSALVIDNIAVKKTPLAMQIFLYYAGMRSISPLVDLTNYLMLELGQPMHAFDAGIVKKIEVDLAKDGDTFTSLDKTVRKLTKDNLMIKNGQEYFAIAGVIGGLDSEILSSTTSVFLESANFEPTTVRKTATSLGLRTEASARYEKSLDPNMTVTAIKRYLYLLREMDKGIKVASNLTDNYPTITKEVPIKLNKEKLATYMGFELEDKKVESILEALQFKVKTNKNSYDVVVPTFRATKDISIEEDLIEEIARMYGYENIKIEPLKLDLTFTEFEHVVDDEYNVKRFLTTKYDLSEVHTYLWYKTVFLKDLGINKSGVTLEGKKEDNILRDDLSLSLLEVAELNAKNRSAFGIYELGTVVVDDENKRILSILICDNENNTEHSYQTVKDIVFKLFKTFKNVEPEFIKNESFEYYNNELTYNVIYDKKCYGTIKVFDKAMASKVAKKKSFVTLDIDFDEFIQLDKKFHLYKPISKYPKVELDYTLIADADSKYENIEKIIDKFQNAYIENYSLIDMFKAENEIKYTIRYLVSSPEKTLTQEDLNNFKKDFIKHVKDNKLNIIE